MTTRAYNPLPKLCLLAGVLLAASPLLADTWTDPATGIPWTYTVTDGKASVGGSSLGNPAVPTSTQGAIVVPTAIGGKPVTEVGNSAFALCSSLTDVTIPAVVTNIGDYAFLNCGALTNVVVLGALNSYDQSNFYDGVSAELTTYVTANWTGPTDMWQERAVKYLTHKVRFHSNGGTGTMADQGVVWYGTTNLTANAFVRDGSEFVGWATNLTGEVVYADGAAISLDDDIDLYAMWRLSPGQAAGGGALEFTTGGYSVWFGMVDNTASSGQSACSGVLGNNQTNWLATSVSGTGRISFNWKVDCEAPGDYLAFRLDDASMDSISGTVDWTQMVYTVTSNADHTLLWLYSKNRSGKAGSDCGWVESVRWQPVPACIVAYEPGADGTGASQSDVCLQDETIALRGVLFTREGYTQTGWATTEGGALAYALGAEYDAGVSFVLHPVWTADGFAMTETVNGVEWTFTVSNATACIGIDDSTAVPVSTRGAIAIPETLGGYPVTRIGDCAFMDCSRITGIVIPNSVTEVGEAAFVGCSALKSVTIPQCVCDDGLWYSFDADVITKVIIPDGVERIGDGAFAGCYNLVSVTIPNSVTNIGAYAFEGCSGLKRVAIPSGVESIGEGAFADCWELTAVTIPAGVTSIADHVFDGCFSLGRVTIPQGVLSIGASAFADCCDLAGVTIPNSVTNIGEQAFIGCATLSSLTIPDSVTVIGEGAFYECSGLASVTIPITYFYNNYGTQYVMQFAFDTTLYGDVVISERPENNYYSYESRIPDYAFSGFVNVTSIKLPDSVTKIGTQAFYGCSSLKNVNLPDATWDEWGNERSRGVWHIGSEAFAWCSSLTSIAIPNSADQIESGAFRNCYSLKDVKIPIYALSSYGKDYLFQFDDPERRLEWETLEITGGWWNDGVEIPEYAFEGLPNLRSVVLPSSVRSVGNSAFRNCPKLESVTIADGVRPQNNGEDWEIGSEAFAGCTSLKRVDIPDRVKYIRSGAFYGCTSLTRVDIPDCVTQIEGDAFHGCVKLTNVSLPDGVTCIGERAFYGCIGLRSIDMPDAVWDAESNEYVGGLREIGGLAFYGCSSLTVVDMPACVETIGLKAFGNCPSLKNVTLPKIVFEFYSDNTYTYTWGSYTNTYTRFDEYARDDYRGVWGVFDEKFQLGDGTYAHCVWENVVVGDGVTNICDNAFSGLATIKSVMIPQSVIAFGDRAFYACSNLVSVTISDGAADVSNVDMVQPDMRRIGMEAFRGCISLKHVEIPCDVMFIADYAFYGCASLESVTIPDSVLGIGGYAFYNCRSLTELTIPGVTEIGNCAFYGCSGLTSLSIGAWLGWNGDYYSYTGYDSGAVGENAFANCYGLKDIAMPISVLEKGLDNVFRFDDSSYPRAWENVVILDEPVSTEDYVSPYPSSGWAVGGFANLPNLRSVKLPAIVTGFWPRAFENCPRLESVTISDAATRPTDYSYAGQLHAIGEAAFSGCVNLKHMDIPDEVMNIENNAFYGCARLESVTIPDGVLEIGNHAFYNCRSLTELTIPDSVGYIGYWAFDGCSGIEKLSIGAGVGIEDWEDRYDFRYDAIGDDAFANCYGLKEVTMPIAVLYCGHDVFRCYDENSSYPRALEKVVILDPPAPTGEDVHLDNWHGLSVGGFANLPNLRSVTLPAMVTGFDERAFYNCPRLESVTISDGAKIPKMSEYYEEWSCRIGYEAFSGCVNLKHVDIPDEVWVIENDAFYGCARLESVTIPDGVIHIGEKAFYNCRSLTELTIPDSVGYIGDWAFNGCSGLTGIVIGVGMGRDRDYEDSGFIGQSAFAECSSLMSVKFMGNAPEIVDDSAFENVATNCTAYVLPDSTGWGVNAGETWKGLRLMYWYYAGFPLVENDADVIVAMAGSADGRLASMITNVVEYYAYWDWAHAVKNKVGEFVGTPEVKSSLHAAPAYLLGATELFDNEPTIEIIDVVMGRVESVSASRPRLAGSSRSSAATMTVSVVVKDGGRAVTVDPAKVAAMFEATSDLRDWDGAAKLTPEVEILGTDANGKMTFAVTPGDGTAPSAFLRIRK